MLNFEVEYKKTDLGKNLSRALQRLRSPDNLLRAIGNRAAKSVRRNFIEQRSPEGAKWPRLKRPRSRGHASPGFGPPLIDTGKLYYSIKSEVRGRDTVAVGFGPYYGRFHDRASQYNVRFPERHFLGLRDTDKAFIQSAAHRFALNAFMDSGGGYGE